ncbi:MarR family winged helix-turn-helix transcriptional regulator [Ahrensia sp. 13_GOM-1096m]|uniref:MarR family winged helix-turn-helix transcriptional regulator n=1 Tax=Ahrensia sp. 13_GOM-1096m TaxID=1380380 RepID=UPI000684835B|nr:MarR family transcriptional regulator [Ahrensia sp. 13_GOM-1096m]
MMKLDVWDRFQNLFQSIENQLAEELRKKSDLGLSEFRTLRSLVQQPDHEMRMLDLAELLHLTQSSTTRLVERLEKRKFVYRDSCPSDGRGKYCVLTEDGKTYIETAIPEFENSIERILKSSFEEKYARSLIRELGQLAST